MTVSNFLKAASIELIVTLNYPAHGLNQVDPKNSLTFVNRKMSGFALNAKWGEALRGNVMVAMFHKHDKHVSWHFNSMFCWFHVL